LDKTQKITFYSLLAGCAFVALLILASAHQSPRAPKQDQANAEGLDKPRGIALDGAGNQYILDSRHDRIEKRSPSGALIKRFGRRGTGDGQFHEPCGIRIDAKGNLYVADTFFTLDPKGGLPWGRIEKFTLDGVFTSSWGRGEKQGDLYGPRDLAVDSQGNVYVSDTGYRRILKYGPDGSFLTQWGKQGRGPGEFDEPFGLDFDKDDNLYVADRLNYRIQVFRPDGAFVREWKVDGWEASQVVEPYVAVDRARGWVYVSDPTKHKVHRYDLKGGKHKEYTQSADGQPLQSPTGLAVASDGNLLVTDGGSNRVVSVKP
jgi:DNA-binding beta-propeller fold protein YncE